MNKIRLAIIGCGGMTGTHKESFEKIKDAVEVTATADIILERAKSASEFLGAAHYASDYHEILQYADAVMIVLPHHLHYEVGMDCLRNGKHVLMEKPLCNTEKQCLDIIRFAKQQKLVLMTAYCMRFHPMVVKLEELIDQRTYGDVFQISIWTEQLTRYEPDHWASSSKNLGGGQLFSHGCHYIDILLRCLGKPVWGSHLGTNYGTPWMEKEGTSNVVMAFENGALGYHFGTWGAMGSKLKYSIHAHFTKGMVEVNLSEGYMTLHRWNTEPELLLTFPMGKYTHFEIQHFADCIIKGAEPETNGPDSLQGLRVIWRMYEAEGKNIVANLHGLGFGQAWDKPGLDQLPAK